MPRRLLEEVLELSAGDKTEALKALPPFRAAGVQRIHVDPASNSRSAFGERGRRGSVRRPF